MAHQVETILAQIVTTLKAGGTDAGARVYRGRTLPVAASEGAGDVINVYEGDESSSLADQQARNKQRSLNVMVELHHRGLPTDQEDPGSVDTAMNDFLREVEIAIEADFTLAGTCMLCTHTGTRRERASADKEYRLVTLDLQVLYRTLRTDPAVKT